jgi:type III restriction enzyme
MLYNLKTYQRDAVDEIKDLFDFFFDKKEKTIVFKSPTGSGKTLMISSVIEEEVAERENDKFCFVWASIGKGELQKQSYHSVKSYVQGHPLCTLLEEDFFGSRSFIKNHEVVFVNWEKLIRKDRGTGQWKNNLMKDSEGHNFLDVINNTKENGTKIILIIDESHIGSSSNTRITEFKDQILQPNMTIEMSATPSNNPDVFVSPQRVIDEGIIKEDIIVNEGISKEDRTLTEKDSELLILEKAEAKRQEIIHAYEEIGANVNPLVLVQIPNTDAGEAKKIVVNDFLREKGITEENGQLKLWYDDKGNFDKNAIKRNDDETNYLIFKTAVATGWDCPRAHILVKFREGHSETFEIQTIGRILRTAEAKKYENSVLDNAYIFTNIASFETTQDSFNPNRIKTEFSYMREPYTKHSVWEQTLLDSFYRSREGDYNSADSRFNEYFEKEFMEYFNLTDEDKYLTWKENVEKLEIKGMNLDIKTKDSLITETSIDTKNVDNTQTISGETTTVRMSDSDIQAQFYAIIRANLNGLAYVRSKSPINTAVVDVFGKFYNAFSRARKISNTHRLMVQNQEIFAAILNKTTLKFREMLQEESGLKGVHYDFKIEDKRGYSMDTHKILELEKSLYQPLRVLITNSETGAVNELEKNFLTYLNNEESVEWFWENGTELMKINFGISYNNGLSTFQPDFLVKFKNGPVGIFDTKPIDYNVEDTTVKAEALWKFIEDTNSDRDNLPKVVGGIVVMKGSAFYYYNQEKYVDMGEDNSNWHLFKELLESL